VVRGTFSLARAWRLTVGPASTRTLGLARRPLATGVPRRLRWEKQPNTSSLRHCRRERARDYESQRRPEPQRRTTPPLSRPEFKQKFKTWMALRAAVLRRAVRLAAQVVDSTVSTAPAAERRPASLRGATQTRSAFTVVAEPTRCAPSHAHGSPCPRRRGLTRRSSRRPTALRLAREAPWFIMRLAGQAQCRWSRLNSNVRQHEYTRAHERDLHQY
jgi:hypothetical protein